MTPELMQSYAAKYEWLREQDWFNNTLCVVRYPKDSVKPGSDCPSRQRLDNFIEQEMKKENSK